MTDGVWVTDGEYYVPETLRSKKSENESRSVVSNSLQPHEMYSPWYSPGQNTGVGSLSLLYGIFPTQGLNPGFLSIRHILYCLSHQESPGAHLTVSRLWLLTKELINEENINLMIKTNNQESL